MLGPSIPDATSGDRPRKIDMHSAMNAFLDLQRTGWQGRCLPRGGFPPCSTVYNIFCEFQADSPLSASLNASFTAAVLEMQSVKTTASGGPRSYGAGKKVKGHKRQALVDTDGRALMLAPQPVDVKDRDEAGPVLEQSRRSYPFIVKAFADADYAGDGPASANPRRRRDRPQAVRTGRFRGPFTPMGRCGLLCPDQPQQEALEAP